MLYPNARDLSLEEAFAEIGEHREGITRANMVLSLDGATAIEGSSAPLSSPTDRALYRHLRATCDAIIVGRETATHPGYAKVGKPIIVVSNSGNLIGLNAGAICITSAAGAERASQYCEDVLVAGLSEVDLPEAIELLHQRGFAKLLCEGGAHLLSALLDQALVGELFLTHSPIIVGNESPRFILNKPLSLTLKQLFEDSGHLFARYA